MGFLTQLFLRRKDHKTHNRKDECHTGKTTNVQKIRGKFTTSMNSDTIFTMVVCEVFWVASVLFWIMLCYLWGDPRYIPVFLEYCDIDGFCSYVIVGKTKSEIYDYMQNPLDSLTTKDNCAASFVKAPQKVEILKDLHAEWLIQSQWYCN